jgi:hypothetical protein
MCRTLLDMKAPGLHFYTLNQLSPTREILIALGFPAVSLPLLPAPVPVPSTVSPSPSPKEGKVCMCVCERCVSVYLFSKE